MTRSLQDEQQHLKWDPERPRSHLQSITGIWKFADLMCESLILQNRVFKDEHAHRMELLALANTEFYTAIVKEPICSDIALGKYMAGRNYSSKEVFQKISRRRGPGTD